MRQSRSWNDRLPAALFAVAPQAGLFALLAVSFTPQHKTDASPETVLFLPPFAAPGAGDRCAATAPQRTGAIGGAGAFHAAGGICSTTNARGPGAQYAGAAGSVGARLGLRA